MATEAERNRGSGAYSTPGVDTPASKGGAFQSAAGAPSVTFALASVAPPSQLYMTTDDQIELSVFSSIPGESVVFYLRMLRADGVIDPQQYIVQAPTARTPSSIRITQAEGFLLSIVAVPIIAATRGQTFVRSTVRRGSATNVTVFGWVLLSDYITIRTGAGWPNGPIHNMVEGPGNLRSIQVSNPAAGADWSTTVPASARWRFQSWRATLTSGAAVANRLVNADFDDGANVFFQAGPQFTQVASTIISYDDTGLQGQAPVAGGAEVQLAAPPTLYMPTGYRIRSNTVALQAADQWTAIELSVEEWLDF